MLAGPSTGTEADITRLLESVLDTTIEHLPEALRASLRKDIITRACLARSHHMLGEFVAQRRDVTRRVHAAKQMEAPDAEVCFLPQSVLAALQWLYQL